MAPDPERQLHFLHALSGAASARAIYPPSHPRVGEALATLERAAAGLGGAGGGEVQIVAIEGELVVAGRPLAADQAQLRALAGGMVRLGIESLTFAPGLDAAECGALVEGLSGAAPLDASAHVAVGRIKLVEGAAEEAAAGLAEADLDRGEEAFRRLREDPQGGVERLGYLVWSMVERLDATVRSLLVLPPTGGDADRELYQHSVNVALLVVAQARSLGLRGQGLHDVGLAALLHDVGKLSLPPALLERRGRLSEREVQVLEMHPVLGAARLCGVPAAPDLAALVAYEHHWRWDGRPSYPERPASRRPGLGSQLTAIADSYDALVAGRGLDGDGPAGEAATAVWRRRAGTWLDPELVTHFLVCIG